MKLSVVVPTTGNRTWLEPCLRSLARHAPADLDHEVLVVLDGADPDASSWIRAEFPEVRLVERPERGGFCAAANSGIAAARGEFIQLLNDDAEVTPGWANSGLLPFRNSRVAAVAPLVLWRDEPNRVDSAGDGFALFGWAYKRGHGEPANRWENRPDERVFACCAAAAFYRASALRKVNGFDPHFGAYYEDVDLAFRLRWAGYECVFTPNSRVLHRVSATYNHARRELQRRVTRNSELVFWTNLPGRWLALAFAPHIVFNLVRLGWKLARGRAGPFVQGELDALRETPWIRDGRRQRSDLAHQAISRPSFPMSFAPIGSLIRQLRLGR